jgi:hypothetical protein
MSIDLNYEKCFNEIASVRLQAPEIRISTPFDVPTIIARNWLRPSYYAQYLSKVGVIIVSVFRVDSALPPIVRIYKWGPECFGEWEAIHETGYFAHLGKSWSNGDSETLGGGNISVNARRVADLMVYPEIKQIQRISSCTSKLSLQQLVRLSYDFALNREKANGSVKIAPHEAFMDVVKNTFCSNLLKGLAVGLFPESSVITLPQGTVRINNIYNFLEGSSEPYVHCLKIGPSNNVLTYHGICFLNITGFKSNTTSLSYLLSTHLLRATVDIRRIITLNFGGLSNFRQCKQSYQLRKYDELTDEQLQALEKLKRLDESRDALLVAIRNTERSVKSLIRDGAVKRIGREIIALGNVVQTPSGTSSFDSRSLQAYYWEIMKQMHELHTMTALVRAKRHRPLAYGGGASDSKNTPTQNAAQGTWDFFICHASEDKTTVARPVADALASRGFKVWYDEFSLKLGDSLRRSIDYGLSRSRYGIVVLSKHFFLKEWPQRELDGLVAKEVSGRKTILPIWHEVDKAYIEKYSPTLADRYAIQTSRGIADIVDAILQNV